MDAIELWAGRCVALAPGGFVAVPHDDGTSPGMVDFLLQRTGMIVGALEVTAVVDEAAIALHRALDVGGRWIVPGLAGGWLVNVLPSARGRRLFAELPGLLGQLEAEKATVAFGASDPWHRTEDQRLTQLGIASANQSGTDFPGSIYLTVPRPIEERAGFVDESGQALVDWVSRWVADPSREDNRTKLARSGATERHLFVVVTSLAAAPFGVQDHLMRSDAGPPLNEPALPFEITSLWLASLWSSGRVFRFSREEGWGWSPKAS